MSYGQINYSQHTGNGPFPIAETGCFVTAFSNLLERFGEAVDPPSLNNYFNQHGTFSLSPEDGPGTRDDLSWGSISAFDGQISTTGVGGVGWPDSDNAIVKFAYVSPRTGSHVTHFCLVADHTQGTIVDSWDGVVKHSGIYGTPVAWAKYEKHAPQPVAPPVPVEQPTYTIEDIGDKQVTLNVDTHLWDLNQRTWPGIVNNPVSSVAKGTQVTAAAIAHHVLGGSYYMPNPNAAQGYNVVDCSDYVAPAPLPAAPLVPTPVPAIFTTNTVEGITYEAYDQPKQMFVIREAGCEKWSFKNVKSWRDFRSVQHVDYGTEVFIVGVAHHPIPPTGADYLMAADDFGNFKKTGVVVNQVGFNYSDLSPTRPAPLVVAPVVTPVLVQTSAEVPTPAPVDPPKAADWRTTYRPFVDGNGMKKSVRYIAMKSYSVPDLEGKLKDVPLNQYDYIIIGGTFTKDGMVYARPQEAADKFLWYGVPLTDQYIQEYNNVFSTKTTVAERQVFHSLKPRDYVVLGLDNISKFAATIEKAWDIFPHKNKQKK